MSAYGSIAGPQFTGSLPSFEYPLSSGETLHTFAVFGTDAHPGLVEYAHGIFNAELAEGKTYPQEGPMDLEAYTGYYFSGVTIVGVLCRTEASSSIRPGSLGEAVAGRSWEDCLGGTYYIKPNYPGRSSHNCNAGFLVPPNQRGKRIGVALAKSFCEYAPRLGYRASVFNLVYANNAASLRLWDSLGFQRVGLIPQAGRLKTGPGGAEEYVDAVVVYKSFVWAAPKNSHHQRINASDNMPIVHTCMGGR